MPLTVVANIHASTGKAPFVHDELKKLVAPTRNEAGCIRYDLHRDKENDLHFMFYETWASRALWQTHMQAPHLATFLRATDGAVEQFTVNEMEQIA